ncbi:MAG TPA: UDP-N-acetylglucosamine 2-epimerase (non-hydrolyzing) [bacterium]|nr:UDP-N-acetylglucosamine 2-epimerase (non-hydrolyzing) [bacterium]
MATLVRTQPAPSRARDASGRLVIMIVFGTRPEAVKLAPVVLALRESHEFLPFVVVTGQHRELLDQVTELFGITPDLDLEIMRTEQSLVDIVTRGLAGLDRALNEVHPDMVLVQGDAHSAFIGALAAYYHRIPIGHVEAGLRTYDKYQPFPEELNRRVTSSLADVHLAPTPRAKANLLREGIPAEAIFVTGNTVIDALAHVRELAGVPPVPGVPETLHRRLLLVTTHRRENWGEPLHETYIALREILDRFADLEMVFSVHPNPAVRRIAEDALREHPRAHLIQPPPYASWIQLMRRAYLILTDSGGIQEEAVALGRPVLVLRRLTERPEGVEAGAMKLVGTDRTKILQEATRLLTDASAYQAMTQVRNPFGDGRASERILQTLRYYYRKTTQRPEEFAG